MIEERYYAQKRPTDPDSGVLDYNLTGRALVGGRSEQVVYGYDSLQRSPARSAVGEFCAVNGNYFDAAAMGGQLAWAEHPAGTTYYSYNALGDVIATYEGGARFDVCALSITRYGYDGLGRLTSVTYPDGLEVQYRHGAGALYPSSVWLVENGTERSLLTGLTYDVDGRLLGFAGRETSLAASFDLEGQFVTRSYSHAEDASFERLRWTVDTDDDGLVSGAERDGNGNYLRLADQTTGKLLVSTYDAQDRLASFDGTRLRGYQDCSLDYDGAGNRTSETCFGKTLSYGYEAGTNMLATASFASEGLACGLEETTELAYRFDESGSQRSGWKQKFAAADTPAWAATMGPRGATMFSSTDDPGAVTYAEEDHRRLRQRLVRRNVGQVHERSFTYDTSGRLLSEVSETSDGAGHRGDYVWLAGEPVMFLWRRGGAAENYVLGTSHLGAPMRAWGESGSAGTEWAADYEPFGRAYVYRPGSSSAPSVEINMRLPGQVEDEGTGLYYNWHRYLEPGGGRYLQADPLSPVAPPPAVLHATGMNWLRNNRVATSGAPYSTLTGWSRRGGVMPVLGDPSMYAYAGNNPMAFMDPVGLRRVGVFIKVRVPDQPSGAQLGDICATNFGATYDGMDMVGAWQYCHTTFGVLECVVECVYADECNPDDGPAGKRNSFSHASRSQ